MGHGIRDSIRAAQPIRFTNQYGAADKITQSDKHLVPRKPDPGNSLAMGQKQGKTHVLKSASHKGKQAPEDQHDFRGFIVRPSRHPHGKAHK